MEFDIRLLEEESAIQIFNDKGDHIVLGLLSLMGFNNMKKFLEDSKK